MHRRDAPIGASFLLLAFAVLWHIRDFPSAPGQPHGPALFPGLIATGLALCSALLMLQAWRAADGRGASSVAPETGIPGPGAGRWFAFALTVGALVCYALLVERLGFLPTAFVLLGGLLWAYGVRRSLIAPIALVAALGIHTAFYKLLKVPLPWGLLSGLAW